MRSTLFILVLTVPGWGCAELNKRGGDKSTSESGTQENGDVAGDAAVGNDGQGAAGGVGDDGQGAANNPEGGAETAQDEGAKNGEPSEAGEPGNTAPPSIDPTTSPETLADRIIKSAHSYIGVATYGELSENYSPNPPYRFRCASFVYHVFRENGVDLATMAEEYMMELGPSVKKEELQKGDLVFFDVIKTDTDPTNHVGIYIGDNKIIHMADAKLNVTVSDLNSTSYYRDNYVGARRVIPNYLPKANPTVGDKIVDYAYSLLEKVKIERQEDPAKMVFNATGFIKHVYAQQSVAVKANYISELAKLGTLVAKEELKTGDLVFFSDKVGSTTPSMVGLYAGNHRVLVPLYGSGVKARVLMVPWTQEQYLFSRRIIP